MTHRSQAPEVGADKAREVGVEGDLVAHHPVLVKVPGVEIDVVPVLAQIRKQRVPVEGVERGVEEVRVRLKDIEVPYPDLLVEVAELVAEPDAEHVAHRDLAVEADRMIVHETAVVDFTVVRRQRAVAPEVALVSRIDARPAYRHLEVAAALQELVDELLCLGKGLSA